MLRRDCRYSLRYASKNFCKLVWFKNACAEPKELELGCDTDGVKCPDYAPLLWKRQQLPPDEREMLDADEKVQVLEWTDADDEVITTKREVE